VSVSTVIPRSKMFRFENCSLKQAEFQNILNQSWNQANMYNDSARNITAKLKILRKKLREWQASMIILFLEVLEDFRDLSLLEWNFKEMLENHLLSLLEKQKIYWKQRGNIKWVQLGDVGTHFFHANATIRYRSKLIT
jgi:hypothetical protein